LTSAIVALSVRGWTAPLIVLTVSFALIVAVGLVRQYIPYLLATSLLLISILLINTFLYPGATDTIFVLGPFTATGTGLIAASQAALRVLAFATSVALFALTTRTDELVDDLERRGLGRRGAFILTTAIGTVPQMTERAREIVDSQRSRALDTQGGVLARIRGLVPLAGPLVLSAFTEVEHRTMALEARAFAAPGRRTVLRVYRDTRLQRTLRWVLVIGTIVLVIAEVAGLLAWVP
jgi:energy-coupling factor transport system permease protein